MARPNCLVSQGSLRKSYFRPMPHEDQYKLIHPGDIVLTRSVGSESRKNRRANLIGQAVASRTIPHFTHVAIADAFGGFLEVNPEGEVKHTYGPDFRSSNPGRYLAIRNGHVAKLAIEEPERFHDSLKYHLGQEYLQDFTKKWGVGKFLEPTSFFSVFKERRETFCSRLSNDCLARFAPEHAIPMANPLPVHFERLKKSDQWSDVTQSHLDQYALKAERSDEHAAEDRQLYEFVAGGNTEIRNLTLISYKEINSMIDVIQAFPIPIGLDELTQIIEAPAEYWDLED